MTSSEKTNGKILIVDDDDAIRTSCRYLLEADGYQVTAVQDGEQALEKLREDTFEVVMTDLQMPRIDGLDLLKEIQKQPDPPTVVIITAFASVQTAVEAMKLGAYDYMPKPVDSERLSATVRRSCETHRLKKEVASRTKELEARTLELQETLAHLRNSQNQLIEQAKLAALGKVASEVAHELRNPLAVAYTAIQLLRSQKLKPPSRKKKDPDDLDEEQAWNVMIRGIKRANEVINNFFALSKDSALVLIPTEIGPLFQDIETMIRGTCLRQKTTLEIRVAEGLPQVCLSAPHFKSTILNLAINAIEALPPEGGRLLLSAQPAPDDRVAVVVEDDGPGIPAEFQNRVFDAFFTTKEKGAGLGLSIVREIVEKHKGTLRLVSDPQKGGAQFTILLPSAGQSSEKRPERR